MREAPLATEERLYAAERAVLDACARRLRDFRLDYMYPDNAAVLKGLRGSNKDSKVALIRAVVRWEKWLKKR